MTPFPDLFLYFVSIRSSHCPVKCCHTRTGIPNFPLVFLFESQQIDVDVDMHMDSNSQVCVDIDGEYIDSSESEYEDSLENRGEQNPSPKPELRIPSRLPPEIELRILENAILPKRDPPPYTISEGFFDPWSYGLHINAPDTRITSVCRLFLDQGHRIFYERKTFLFGQTRIWTHLPNNVDREIWPEYRDPIATRLLDFTDRPDWKNIGSNSFISLSGRDDAYAHVDKYRYLIRTLILKSDFKFAPLQSDWDWPLKVDWTTLPNVRVLYLDLLPYSRRIHCSNVEAEEIYNEKLVDGAGCMGGLKLEKLVLVGLCSLFYWNNAEHKHVIERLFKPALGVGGNIEFLDQQYDDMW